MRWANWLILVCCALYVGVLLTPTGFYAAVGKLVSSDKAADWVQAIGSIAAILVSVFGSMWLQDRGRRVAGERQQVVATTLANESVTVLGHIDRRARAGELTRGRIRRYHDELDELERGLLGVDLLLIPGQDAVPAIAALRRQLRAARRRLDYAQSAIDGGRDYNRLAYQSPLQRAAQHRDQIAGRQR